jgi:hydroxymethylbilane synthase
MLPAVAQGAICVEIRAGDGETRGLLAAIHDEDSATRVNTERAFLAELDGSCRTPIAGLAQLEQGRLRFRGQILTPDGAQSHETSREGLPEDGAAMGIDAARELLAKAGPDFFRALR